jgi:Tfp pilus assembly protein PilX
MRPHRVIRNETGAALPMAALMLLILTTLTLAVGSLGSVESLISRNLSDGARARQLAETGLEYALNMLAGQDFSTKLAAGSTLVAYGTTLPGLTAAQGGTFGVSIRNDIQNGDMLLTGAAALDASGSNTSDSNGILIVTSTGTFNGAVRQATAAVRRGQLGINAAVTLPGFQADTISYTPCPNTPCPPNPLRDYSIDGRDWLRTDGGGPTGGNPMKFGLAVQPGVQPNLGITYEQNAENGFDDVYKRAAIQGKHQSTGVLTTGLQTIAPDSTLTPAAIQQFMSNLAANPATQILTSTQACQYAAAGGGDHNKPEGLRMASTGTNNVVTVTNNCTGGSQISKTVNLGSPTSPVLLYFKGEYDPNSNFVGLAVDGANPIQGYGLLVVEDADLIFFQNNFRWDGVVLVTGRNVAIGFKGSSNTEIRGAVIGNETNSNEPNSYFEFANFTTGSMKLRYGKGNIDMALRGLYNMTLGVYREN